MNFNNTNMNYHTENFAKSNPMTDNNTRPFSSPSTSTSTNDIKNLANSKRTRITRACDACRRKKIKCDVDSSSPCTNCQQCNWECTFKDASKKRGPPKGYIESLEYRLAKMEQLLKATNEDPGPSEDQEKRKKRATSRSGEKKQKKSRHKPKVVRYHGSSSGYYLVGNILSEDRNLADSNEQTSLSIMRSSNTKLDYRFRKVNLIDDDLMVVRDATLDEVADQLADDEQETMTGLIPKSILNTLVHTFFKVVHNTLPVIDKNDFLDAYEERTTPPPSPLLVYSIGAYACFLLKSSDPMFKEAGMERDFIFQVLLERAILMIKKEYLKPRISTIQALVLLCAHPTYSTNSYRNWIMVGVAVRMAQDLGLHRTLSTVELTDEAKERNKLLWYAVYTTDRWNCAIMGRPLAIADSDCDVDLPLVHGVNGEENITMFVYFIKLSAILGEILRRVYSPRAKANGLRSKPMEFVVTHLQKMLENWFESVPEGYKITKKDLEEIKRHPSLYSHDSVKLTQGGPLTLCYHAVVSLLHRPFVALETDGTSEFSTSKAFELCRESARHTIDIAVTIPSASVAIFGWNFAAYSVFQASLIHLYNSTNSDPEVVKEAKEYVRACTEKCLEPLAKEIPAGPPLASFLRSLMKLLKSNLGIETKAHTDEAKQQNIYQEPERFENPTHQSLYTFQQSFQEVSLSQSPTDMLNSNLSTDSNRIGLSMDAAENGNQSWLLNGPDNFTSPLSQSTWQQLFSTAGAPFNEDPSKRVDVQNWDKFFMDCQSSNIFM